MVVIRQLIRELSYQVSVEFVADTLLRKFRPGQESWVYGI